MRRPLLLAILVAAAACTSDEVGTDTDTVCNTTPTTAPDDDGDGFTADDDCDDASADIHPGLAELCDGIDNNCDGRIDEGIADSDEDGVADCIDTEECDGRDNNGDGSIDEGFADTDSDGIADCIDIEDCDGRDNNGDGSIDEGFADTDSDGIADCIDTEECDGLDNDGDGRTDEDFPDTDSDGIADCIDTEECDGLDNDGDGRTDEDFPDTDSDGIADCIDTEECDGLDNDGDGEVDEEFPDTDSDGVADCVDTEECDGLDNDGDGEVDEEFPDTDSDGVADCIDDSCELTPTEPGEVAIDETCAFPQDPVEDAFNLIEEWSWSEPEADVNGGVQGSGQSPMVAHLQDTNGDGVIDTTDVPVILFGSVTNNLYALSGDDGELLWTFPGINFYANQGFADVDDDGELEIIAYNLQNKLVAIETDGSGLVWTAPTAEPSQFIAPVVEVADIDGDGTAELLGMAGVYNSEDGALDTTITMLTQPGYFAPTSADLDGDGNSELIYGFDVFDHDGVHQWSIAPGPPSDTPLRLLWSAPVNVDNDPEGELIAVGVGMLALYDSDGTQLAYVALTEANQPGPPCVGDYDGDGDIEVAWSSGGALVLFELDGQLVWSVPAQDASGAAGCSAYDLDADGFMEVLFASENSLIVVDGSTGVERYRNTSHASGTLFEWPTIADVDGDGSAEFVYVSNRFFENGPYPGSLHVVGHVDDGWYSPGTTWMGFNWGLGGQAWDGSFPEGSNQRWNEYNLWRALPSSDTAASNLVVSLGDQCLSSCDSSIGVTSVEVIVSNTGSADIDQTFEVTLLVDDGESTTLLDSVFVDGIGGGSSSAGLRFDVPIDVAFSGDLRFEADISGAVIQCSEEGDLVTWTPPSCGVSEL